MTTESPENEKKSPEPVKRRGPRKEADIRAEMEEEIRAQIRAELEAEAAAPASTPSIEEIREQARAEIAAEYAAREAEAEKQRALAAEARPIHATQIDGDPNVQGSLTVHFVEDGLTLLGKVWYRGEELTINPDTPQWEEAHSVLSMDEYAQEERWGRRYFREGLWRGKRLNEIDDEELTDEERRQLEKAARIREEKYGAIAN